MLIPCNKRNTETSVFGQRSHQFLHSLLLVHKQFCGGCVPRRTSSGVVAPRFFPACSVIWAPGHSHATSQIPPLSRALSNLYSLPTRLLFHIAVTARFATEVWSNSVHLFLASFPDLVRYCFTVPSLSHLVLEKSFITLYLLKCLNLSIASFVHGQFNAPSVTQLYTWDTMRALFIFRRTDFAM